ncbi:MAG: hypothetical protein ACE5IR_12885 [bacterium]
MALITFAQQLPEATLTSLPRAFLDEVEFAYALAWNPTDVVFEPFEDFSSLAAFHGGRVWGVSMDLQWQKRGNMHNLVLITEDEDNIPDFFPQENHLKLVDPPRTERAFFWGEYDDEINEWLEIKIPRRIDYAPFFTSQGSPPTRVQIEIFEYVLQEKCKLWQFGEPVEIPVISKVYRYGKLVSA